MTPNLSLASHMAGRNISAGTYNSGCRCEACRSAYGLYARERMTPAKRSRNAARQRATRAAVLWVQTNHPELWEQMLRDARQAES